LVRVVVLLTAALTAVQRGVSYLPSVDDTPPVALTYVEWWLPLSVWGVVWIMLGGVVALSIAMPVLVIPAMSAFVGLHIAWGASLLASWLLDNEPDTWVTGGNTAAIAMFAAVLVFTFDRPDPAAHI
jgi:hypothetical protein